MQFQSVVARLDARGAAMPRDVKRPDASRRTLMPAELPGVPLVAPIEASGLMLATLYRRPFSDPAWIYELKYDGFRCLVRKMAEHVDLISRNGNSLNRAFPDIVSALAAVPGDFVWDAELTVDDPDGRSSFQRLQKRAKTSVASRVRAAAAEHPARLYVFDILAFGNRDLRALPLRARKAILRDCFADTGTLIYASGIVAAGEWVFEQVVANRLEGMVGKRLDSPYRRGRSPDWRKVKFAGYGAQGFTRKATE